MARSAPLKLGTSAPMVALCASACAMTLSTSANCGMILGGTKEPASISRTPAATIASISAHFASVGTKMSRFCRPSRGPTSQIWTASGAFAIWFDLPGRIVISCNKEQSVGHSVKSERDGVLVPIHDHSRNRPPKSGGDGATSRRAELTAGQILALARREGMRPGDRLIEQRLADALDLSRGPIRLGLKALAAAGLAKGEPNCGFVLT